VNLNAENPEVNNSHYSHQSLVLTSNTTVTVVGVNCLFFRPVFGTHSSGCHSLSELWSHRVQTTCIHNRTL
jgi:hypothetical protein